MTTPNHHPCTPAPKTSSAAQRPPASNPAPGLLRTRFSAAQLLDRFHQLLPARRLDRWLGPGPRSFYRRAFTPLITLWYLVFQRLNYNHHLSYVVQDALAGGADRLSPRGKKLSRQLRSEATSSFSDARQRLPLELCRRVLRHSAAQMAACLQAPRRFGLQVALMDGSTCRARPYGDIPQHFPAHRPGNCTKPPYWCVARIIGILCLATGAVLDSALDALKVSEQALGARLMSQRCWKGWLLLADRNFGIYSVTRAAVAAQAQVLFRLTQSRATRLARAAGLKLKPGLDALICWSASTHDQCPPGLTATPIAGRLVALRLERAGYRSLTLYLFTTLVDQRDAPAHELAHLYAQRWNIELCLRYIKAQMDLGFLQCHSVDMLYKEWLTGLIAYNLIRWTMAAAASLAQLPLPLLSFSRARELLLGWILRTWPQRPRLKAWKRLLTRIAKARLPKRRKRRLSEPRAVRAFNTCFLKLEGSRADARRKLAKSYVKS